MRVAADTEARVSKVIITMLSQRRRKMSRYSRGSTEPPVFSWIETSISCHAAPARPNLNQLLARNVDCGVRLSKTRPPASSSADGLQPDDPHPLSTKAVEETGQLLSQVCSLPPASTGLPCDVQEVQPSARAWA